MPRKLEHESEDPKYPDIVLVTPAWREVSKERRRSTTQLIEQRALCAFLQNEEARQRHLSPYWTPKIQEVKETKNIDSKQNEPSLTRSSFSTLFSNNSISNSRAIISSSPSQDQIGGQSQQKERRDDPISLEGNTSKWMTSSYQYTYDNDRGQIQEMVKGEVGIRKWAVRA